MILIARRRIEYQGRKQRAKKEIRFLCKVSHGQRLRWKEGGEKESQVDALLHTYPRRAKVVRCATTLLDGNADPRVAAITTTTPTNKMKRRCCCCSDIILLAGKYVPPGIIFIPFTHQFACIAIQNVNIDSWNEWVTPRRIDALSCHSPSVLTSGSGSKRDSPATDVRSFVDGEYIHMYVAYRNWYGVGSRGRPKIALRKHLPTSPSRYLFRVPQYANNRAPWHQLTSQTHPLARFFLILFQIHYVATAQSFIHLGSWSIS